MKTRKKPISNKELLASLRKDPEYRAAEKRLESRRILASNILRYRAERDFTQKALADMAGVRQPRIADLEGMKGNPSLETLEKVALALGVTPADLLSQPSPKTASKKEARPQKVEVDLIGLLQVTASVRFNQSAWADGVEEGMPFMKSAHASHRMKLPH